MDDDENEADPIASLITNYYELSPPRVEDLECEPSELDFMRYVLQNRPFVVRKYARNFPAVKKWNASYLREAMHGREVKVAVTPTGNADAIVQDEHGRLLFVEPHEIDEDFGSLLDYIRDDRSSTQTPRNVKYAQSQNDNLLSEYRPLLPDILPDIPFATKAFNEPPTATNFWLGNERSTTALHKDNFENIYIQIRGQKNFLLLPPCAAPCVNEYPVPFGRYHPTANNGQNLEPRPNTDGSLTPVPLWDPDAPDARSTKYSHLCYPISVSLNESDMLYLPATWFHKVTQISGDEGFSCSVNYWYDMEFAGPLWLQGTFLRDVYNREKKAVQYPDLVMGEESS